VAACSGGDRVGREPRTVPSRAVARAWGESPFLPRVTAWVVAVALYLLAVAVLLSPWPFAALPGSAYNWEGYTAWRWTTYWEPPAGPTFEIWAPTDGLMTDSGQGPLVGLPASIGIAFGGFTIEAMRIPVMLLAAASAPLLWLFGRRIAGPGPAALAAVLLVTSPAFLLYGRTATLVGVSLVPLLATALVLVRVIDAPREAGWSWGREGVLAVTLLFGIYAYAPVRLLWPTTIAVLGFVALRVRARRGVLLKAALLCLLVVPAATMTVEQIGRAEPNPGQAAIRYFHARGEQAVAMSGDPARAKDYLREPLTAQESSWEPLRSLVAQNTVDLGRLLLDRDTRPVLTDYWNENGRFWPWFFVPFAIMGTAAVVWRGVRRNGALLLPLALLAGLTLPLLLTSKVHIGRLLPALPFALLLVAVGIWAGGNWLASWARVWGATGARVLAPVLAGAVLLPAIATTRADLGTPAPPTREALTATTLAAWSSEVAERGGAVLVEDPALGDEIERVHAATYRLGLDRQYRFVDLQQRGAVGNADGRPAIYWRGALPALSAGEISAPCERLWFVSPEIAVAFLDAWRDAGCRGAPDSVVLP
jgi:4-amino-4-deoxy-L-arabinose transferase-like glycosyltransferase